MGPGPPYAIMGPAPQQTIMGHNRLLWVQTASYMPEDSAYPSHIPSLRQTRTVCLMYHRTAPPQPLTIFKNQQGNPLLHFVKSPLWLHLAKQEL